MPTQRRRKPTTETESFPSDQLSEFEGVSRPKENGFEDPPQPPVKSFYTSKTLWQSIVAFPSQVIFAIMGALGLAIYPRQIITILPKNPATLQGVEGEVSISQWIKDSVPSLKGTFTPTWWLPNGHFQTGFSVVGDFSKVDKVEYARTYLRLPDGGTLGLDFTPANHASLPDNTPTLVVCHGLTGGSYESYVRNVVCRIIKPVEEGGLGARVVVVNFRGCAGVPLTSDQMYSAGTTLDLATSLHYLRSQYPKSPLHGIGFSLGASVMSRYLGESSSSSLLSSGAVLGTPWDIPRMTIRLEHNWFYSRVYSKAMGTNLINLFFRHYDVRPEVFDRSSRVPNLAEKLTDMKKKRVTLKGVDEVVTSKIGGPSGIGLWPFKGADEYYAWASPNSVLSGVRRPLLAINSFDDPIIDGTALPIEEFQQNEWSTLAITGAGGHLGWFTGSRAKDRWVVKPVLEFFRAAFRDLPIAGPPVVTETLTPNLEVSKVDSWENISDSEVRSKPGQEQTSSEPEEIENAEKAENGESKWQWVKEMAHGVSGIGQAEGGGGGRMGWSVLDEGEVRKGAVKEQSGTLQGL